VVSSEWSDVIKATEATAAKLWTLGGNISETRDQQPAMRGALKSQPGWRVDEHQTTLPLPGWCHRPGGIDVSATDPAGRRWVGELKLRKTDEILWDLVKVADALRVSGTSAGFLQVGAMPSASREDMCLELLQPEAAVHDTVSLFRTNRIAWVWLLQGGTARPVELPHAIRTTVMADPKIRLDNKASKLLLISVEPDWSAPIRMDRDWWCGDWPPGVEPHARYVVWCRRRVKTDPPLPVEN